jgi:hypothetical protein
MLMVQPAEPLVNARAWMLPVRKSAVIPIDGHRAQGAAPLAGIPNAPDPPWYNSAFTNPYFT